MVFFAEAHASASDTEDGYYRAWCHVGNGANDYKGGAFLGGVNANSSSAAVHNELGTEPTPYFASSYCH